MSHLLQQTLPEQAKLVKSTTAWVLNCFSDPACLPVLTVTLQSRETETR
jgi:hypothetical protein